MKLRTIVLGAKLKELKKQLDELVKKDDNFTSRANELKTAFAEITAETPAEDRAAVEKEIEDFDAEQETHEAEKKRISEEIAATEDELKQLEDKQENTQPEETPAENNGSQPKERKTNTIMIERMKKIFGTRTSAEINALIADEKAKEFLTRAREVMQNKRSIVNAGLLIPEVWLGVIRENVERYSKLYGRVYVRTIKGTGRVIVAGSIPEAVWTECCAKLNEIALGFNAWEVDCYKTGAYIPVCNATLEDSDLNLAAEIMDAISIGIAMSLDKAIVWGRNIAANSKMPLGIVPSLAQTAQPADYPTTARPWVDLHTTNIVSITSTSGLALLKDLVKASAVAASKYSRGRITWILNEKTYKNVVAETLSVNAAGAVVSAVNGTMPVISGDFIVLDFLPDDVLIFGYLDNYLLADRQRVELGQSEHVQFIEDNTVFKGTARYDGAPVIREAFGVALLNGAELDLTDVTFPQDTANA